jgi:hypothetical protein
MSEIASASQLGPGIHLSMLQQIDKTLETGHHFAPHLELFKEQLLEDVFDKGVDYWQSRGKIWAELDQILSSPPKCRAANPFPTKPLLVRAV